MPSGSDSAKPSPAPAAPIRLLRQHAMTLRLMGVDCLPIADGVDLGPAAAAPEAPAERPAPAARAAPAEPVREAPAAAPAPAAARPAPPRPVPPRPAPAAPAPVQRAPIDPGAGLVPPLVEIKHTDPERVKAQRELDDIRARYEADAPHRHFVTDHHSIVFGEGDPRARLMFIGEAPGADEDRTGRPFVGRAGQLLTKMIGAIGLRREDVYIANVLKTRPPNNATPTSDECARCAPYLYDQIAAVKPEVIVTLGLPATRVLLNTMEPMNKLRGRWSTFTPPSFMGGAGRSVPVMPTYHPAFLLRAYTRENRQKVWADLQMVAERLGLKPSPAGGAGPD
jgi:DNA polymerase